MEAVRLLRLAANRGDAISQNYLGVLYLHGSGWHADCVPKDNDEAARFFELAAEQGDSNAQYNLSEIYYRIGASSRRSRRLLQLAAKQGHTDAQKNWLYVAGNLSLGFGLRKILFMVRAQAELPVRADYYIGRQGMN